jgi:hypothetical protein
LLRCEPTEYLDAARHQFSRLDFGILHIDCTDAELPVAQSALVMMRHVVFDQIGRASDVTDLIRLIASGIEIAMANLPIILFADRVITLTNMHRNMDLGRQAFDRRIDRLDRGGNLIFAGHREQRLVDLNIPAAGVGQQNEAEIGRLQNAIPAVAAG